MTMSEDRLSHGDIARAMGRAAKNGAHHIEAVIITTGDVPDGHDNETGAIVEWAENPASDVKPDPGTNLRPVELDNNGS